MIKLGIPRSLFYFYYYPGWQRYFSSLGIKTVLSPITNKKILDKGISLAADDLCLPFKAYFGHIDWLINYGVDKIIVPRLLSFGKKDKFCPKFMGLPDMVVNIFTDKLPPIIEPVFDSNSGIFPFYRNAHRVGRRLGYNYIKREAAYWKAFQIQFRYNKLIKEGLRPDQLLKYYKNGVFNLEENKVRSKEKNLKILLLGHTYILGDEYLNMGLVKILNTLGVKCIFPKMVKAKTFAKYNDFQQKPVFWYFNRQIMGAAYYYLKKTNQEIDGMIQVTAFGCGPDSLIGEMINIMGNKNDKISILNLNLDELTGREGLITRIEAFIDLLKRRKSA